MKDHLKKSSQIKDKNGIEIYVGDILRVTYGSSDSNFSANELVIFENGKFLLQHRNGISTFDSPHFSYEIIGNITENPHLFEDRFHISFWGD